MIVLANLPRCPRHPGGKPCPGTLLPLGDFGGPANGGAASVTPKSWVCSHEPCGFGVAIDSGQPGYIDKVGKREEKCKRGRD